MPRRRNAVFALFLLVAFLSGCAEQNADLPPAAQAAMQTSFADGGAMLSCNLDCAGNYGFHRQALKALYDSGNWRGLAMEVLTIGENIDQAWFYLGAAAEGLGDDEAAQRYYFISLISRFRCGHAINICDGLDLPALTERRLDTLDAKLLASAAFAQLVLPPDPPGAVANIRMINSAGLVQVPALLDGKIPVLFEVDSGSSGVAIPEGLAQLMADQGLLKKADVVGVANAVLANGGTAPVLIFHISSLQVGGIVLKNVLGGITPGPGELLLGQSFLNRFKSWSIDNTRQTLILQPN